VFVAEGPAHWLRLACPVQAECKDTNLSGRKLLFLVSGFRILGGNLGEAQNSPEIINFTVDSGNSKPRLGIPAIHGEINYFR
jgi:hypothetical protein